MVKKVKKKTLYKILFFIICLIFILLLFHFIFNKNHYDDELEIIEIENFLNDYEINEILKIGISKLETSTIMGEDNNYIDDSIRKSETAYLKDNSILINIKKKASKYTKLPWNNAEDIQLLKYKPNGEYKAHYDFFINDNNKLYNDSIKQGGQRIYSFLIYLNDNFSGGETEFPKLKKKIIPKKGKAVFWKNLNNNGTPNYLSFHSGNKINNGIKYVCNLWIRENKFMI